MAAAGLEPPNHFIHSSAGSESLPARKLGLRGGGGGRRGREKKGGRGGPPGLPQRPGLSLILLWGLWTESERSHQVIRRAGLPDHWESALLLCSRQSVRPCRFSSVYAEACARHRERSEQPPSPGELGACLERQEKSKRMTEPGKVWSIFPPQNVPGIHSFFSAPWPPSWFVPSPLDKAF